MKNLFDNSGNYYDLIYSDKNTNSEVDYIEALLIENNLRGKHILELGSGTGRHGVRLAKRGYEVIGVERSKTMVSKVESCIGFNSILGDITDINLFRKFDVVLALFHVASYQTSNQDFNRLFKTASLHLKKDGLFIFDFWYSAAVLHQQPEIRIQRFENDNHRIIRIAEPTHQVNENTVIVKYSFIVEDKFSHKLHEFEEVHPMRYFSIPEIRQYAENSGFEFISIKDWLTNKKVSEETWGPCVVLQKI